MVMMAVRGIHPQRLRFLSDLWAVSRHQKLKHGDIIYVSIHIRQQWLKFEEL
jgi:hypothetical protein